MSFKQIVLDVSQKVNGAFAKVGEMTVHVPLLADCMAFINAEQKKDEKGQLVEEEGLPVYTDDRANWLQGAILAMVKAQARNKLVPKTATVKDGLKIAETWEELTAEGVRDGAGLAIARECKAAFGEWLAKQGLSEKASATLNILFGNRDALMLQTNGIKGKTKARVESFAESLEPEILEKFTRPITRVLEACEPTPEDAEAEF